MYKTPAADAHTLRGFIRAKLASAPVTATVPAKQDAGTPTGNGVVRAVVAGAKRLLQSTEATEICTLNGELADLKTQIAKISAETAAIHASLDSWCVALGMTRHDISGKTASEINQLIEARIRMHATDAVQAMGCPPSTSSEDARLPEFGVAHFNSITDPSAKAEFYERNKASLIGSEPSASRHMPYQWHPTFD